MSEPITVKVDKSVMTLLNVASWSNLVCIALLVAINLVNFFKGNLGAAAQTAEEGGTGSILSPDILLFISVIVIIWLIVRILSVRRVKRRMEHVYLSIEGDTVSGVSMAAPAAASKEYPKGQSFSVKASEILEVTGREVSLGHRQVAPALVIRTDRDSFVVPGISGMDAVKARLLSMKDGQMV